jgi:P27 family predicted phage terminase small subunit
MPRPRLPTNLKILKGTARKHRLNPDEPKLDIEVPDPPSHLSKYALREWHRMGAILYNMGVITQADRAIFAAYCQAYGRWKAAEEDLEKTNTNIIKTQSGNVIQNPLLGIVNKAWDKVVIASRELGLTPSARSKVIAGAKPSEKKGKSRWEK